MSGTVVAMPNLDSVLDRHSATMNGPVDPTASLVRASSGEGRPTSRNMTSAQERLTPMPGYMSPIVKSAVRKWKKLHEDHMMNKLMVKHAERKEINQVTREDARRLAKKIPMEVLAKDWLSDSRATIETRAFLVEKVLPTLITGCEKLLIEVDRRGFALAERTDPSFNPINFLAQYLMRNNPRYSNFSEASPYIRGLREISEELKKQLFDIEDNRLARIKSEAQKRREDRESAERRRVMEKQRREDLLRRQFNEWNVTYFPNGRVGLALLQNALRLFSETTELLPEELRGQASFSQEIGPTDDTGKMLSQKEFVAIIQTYVEQMPPGVFNQFLAHMDRCASAYRAQSEREQRKETLFQLFQSCDNAGVALLDRHRILNLFEMFFDKAKEAIQETLRNPREWPVVDIQEIGSDYEEEYVPAEPQAEELTAEVSAEAKAEDEPGTEEKEPSSEKGTVEDDEKDAEGDQVSSEESKVEASESAKTGGKLSGDIMTEEEVKTDKPEEQKDMEDTTQAKVVRRIEGKETEVKTPEDVELATRTSPVGDSETSVAQSGDGAEQLAAEATTEATFGNKNGAEKAEGVNDVAAEEVDPSEEGNKDVVDTRKVPEQEMTAEAAEASAEEKRNDIEVAEKEKAAYEIPAKEKDEAEAIVLTGRRVATAKDERDPELTRLLDREANPSQLTVETDNSAELERPSMTQHSKVSFAEGTNFQRERTSIGASGNSRSQSQASAFDENTVNRSQFVHLIETFLGDIPNMEAFHQLVRFIKTGYMETEEERMQRLFKARQDAQEAKRKSLLNSLFEMWDNDGSGSVDFEEVESIMKKYKEGQESESINQAKKEFKKKTRIQDNRINKREFREFVHHVVKKMSGEDAFDYFVDFMLNSVERSYAERVRGEARKKWLQQIVNTAYTSGASLEPVYKAVFQALYKDADTHGHNKVISANIAMLERNDIVADRGEFMLRYVAATPDDAPYMLGKALFRDMKGISFASVDSGKPIHVPRVSNHGNIHFWNPEREEVEDNYGRPKDGSFIVVPLKDRKKRVFGLLGVDTLNDPHSRALFITHEIQFFQGVTRAFSIAYHHVDVRQKTMRISESAVSWIHRRSPHVHEITVYMVEPDGKGLEYVLRKMMTTDHKGTTGLKKNPPKLERRDNLFRDYLFKCVDNSESVTADAYGERHLAIPLRDDEGLAIVCIDISIGDLKELPRNESREVMKMLRLLQTAYKEISHESKEGERTMLLEGDKLDDDSRTEILFDRLMLLELRENVSKLVPTSYAELKSYVDPPRVVHMIVKAVISIFYSDKAREGEFDQWSQCKQYVSPQLSDQIKVYDPTSDLSNDNVPVEMIHADLDEVPHGQVYKHGSIPAQYLYNWVFVCISLIEHSRKMRNSSRSDLLTEIPPPVKKHEPSNANNSQPQLSTEQTMASVAESKDDATVIQTEISKEVAPKEEAAKEEGK